MIFYITSIDTFYLEVFLTSKSSIDNFSLSRTVFEMFDFKVFRVWPWPLTSEVHLGSNNVIPFESPYMTSYLTSTDTISLSHTVLEIFDFNVFRVWPWPLNSKSHLRSKKFIPFESPYMTSYLTYIDTISLSRTVLEIFDFKVFRVWPWLSTSKGRLGQMFLYYSIAHIWFPIWFLWTPSLYHRTVFKIFDFKFFRVLPWVLFDLLRPSGVHFYTIRNRRFLAEKSLSCAPGIGRRFSDDLSKRGGAYVVKRDLRFAGWLLDRSLKVSEESLNFMRKWMGSQ